MRCGNGETRQGKGLPTTREAALIAAVLYVPYLRDLFRFAPLHADDLALCFTAALAGLLGFEFYKVVVARRTAVAPVAAARADHPQKRPG